MSGVYYYIYPMRRKWASFAISLIFILQLGGGIMFYAECRIQSLINEQQCDCEKFIVSPGPDDHLPILNSTVQLPVEWVGSIQFTGSVPGINVTLSECHIDFDSHYRFQLHQRLFRPPIA